jgi:hypothetical protein
LALGKTRGISSSASIRALWRGGGGAAGVFIAIRPKILPKKFNMTFSL